MTAAGTNLTPDRAAPMSSRQGKFRRFLPPALLVLAAIMVRVPGLDRPLVGNFATKSAVYAMIARNWALDRAPLSRPTIDLAAGDERAWHLMEWPAPAFAAAVGWRTFGGSLDAWGRGISIFCSAAAVGLMWLYVRRRLGDAAALVAAGVIAFSPVSVVYGQCFMLEAPLMMLMLLVLYAFERGWTARNSSRAAAWFLVSGLAFSAAVATKIYMLMLVPVLLVCAWEQARATTWNVPRWATALAIFFLTALPTALWYAEVLSISTSVAAAADHHPLDRATVHGIPHPLLFEAKFYARLAADFATHVLTPIGLLCVGAGLAWGRKSLSSTHVALLAVSALLVVALPLKFYVANYYYVVLLPAAAIATATAWQALQTRYVFTAKTQAAWAVVALGFAARYAIGPAFVTPPGDRSVEVAAAAARDSSTPEEPVATLHGSGVDLLYYCNRRGWALNADSPKFAESLKAAIDGGAKLLVVADLKTAYRTPTTQAVLQALPLVDEGDDWQVLALPNRELVT
ncbi:MAG: glycosyltransferase family 39 protein, partial [Planctomycetes bacterium]|nr:glycosyltransferase family 39 protein [Planctomycetota bacterium]